MKGGGDIGNEGGVFLYERVEENKIIVERSKEEGKEVGMGL